MSIELFLQLAFAVSWTVGYVVWSRTYYRTVDPPLRALIGGRLGTHLRWVHRQGTGGEPLRFGPRYATWTWGVADPHARTAVNDSLVYVLYVLIVPVLAGLWPVALLLGLALGLRWLHPLITLVLVFAIIPIYSVYWAGRYQLPGMNMD